MNMKIIKGRLVRNPEYTQKPEENKSFAKWTVATDRRFGDETDYHDCIIFGKRAGVVDKWLTKGSEILCWGEEHHEPYTGRDGVKRKSVTLFVDGFDFCGSRKDNGQAAAQIAQDAAALLMPDTMQAQEEDIPF